MAPSIRLWKTSESSSARIVSGALLSVLVSWFLLRLWVCDDAYITFRSVEQLFAGNGPRWNPHERVQVFTSVAWFFLSSLARCFSSDVFVNSAALSLAALLSLTMSLRKLSPSQAAWCTGAAIVLGSRAVFDFAVSGLENPLSFALIAAFALCMRDCFALEPRPLIEHLRSARWLHLLFALLILTRQDLGILAAPALVDFWVRDRRLATTEKLKALAPAFGLIASWTVFATFYYGFPLPNTAYAKVFNGIQRRELMAQGLAYLWRSAQFDALGAAVVLGAFGSLLRGPRWQRGLGVGLALHLVYVVSVGGDFMAGRFLGPDVVLSICLLLPRAPLGGRNAAAAFLGVVAFAIGAVTLAPPMDGTGQCPDGVCDERRFYEGASTLRVYLTASASSGGVFPDHEWSRLGIADRADAEVVVRSNIGYYGYWVGREKKIIDRLALSDPFLARLPSEGPWRIGHFLRRLPEGYRESVASGRNRLEDRKYDRLYDDVALVTRGNLWDRRRFEAMARLNLGAARAD